MERLEKRRIRKTRAIERPKRDQVFFLDDPATPLVFLRRISRWQMRDRFLGKALLNLGVLKLIKIASVVLFSRNLWTVFVVVNFTVILTHAVDRSLNVKLQSWNHVVNLSRNRRENKPRGIHVKKFFIFAWAVDSIAWEARKCVYKSYSFPLLTTPVVGCFEKLVFTPLDWQLSWVLLTYVAVWLALEDGNI